MSHKAQLESLVRLGSGDLINVAYEWADNGQPVWIASDHEPATTMPALYVCANDEPQKEPFKVAYAGSVKLRQDPNGLWEPNLYAYGYGSTVPAVAVRVLGTLAADTVQELMERNLHYLADRPKLHEQQLSRIRSRYPAQVRRPNVYAVLADLSLVEDPAPYLVRQ